MSPSSMVEDTNVPGRPPTRPLPWGGEVTILSTMRLLRALVHLVLALALIGVAVAPARATGFAPMPVSERHSDMDHHSSGVHVGDAGHDLNAPASEHPAHKRDGCQTACCFIPSQLPPPAPGATAVEFFCAVRYSNVAEPASGRADAPEPGIPKAVL